MHRIFADTDFRAIEKQIVKGDSHIHRHFVAHFFQFALLFFDNELGHCHLIGDRSSSVNIFERPDRRVVILVPQTGLVLGLSLVREPGRDDRRQITGARLDQSAARGFHFFARDNDLWILRIGQGHALFDLVTGRLGLRVIEKSNREQGAQQGRYPGGGVWFWHPRKCLHASLSYGSFHAQIVVAPLIGRDLTYHYLP